MFVCFLWAPLLQYLKVSVFLTFRTLLASETASNGHIFEYGSVKGSWCMVSQYIKIAAGQPQQRMTNVHLLSWPDPAPLATVVACHTTDTPTTSAHHCNTARTPERSTEHQKLESTSATSAWLLIDLPHHQWAPVQHCHVPEHWTEHQTSTCLLKLESSPLLLLLLLMLLLLICFAADTHHIDILPKNCTGSLDIRPY